MTADPIIMMETTTPSNNDSAQQAEAEPSVELAEEKAAELQKESLEMAFQKLPELPLHREIPQNPAEKTAEFEIDHDDDDDEVVLSMDDMQSSTSKNGLKLERRKSSESIRSNGSNASGSQRRRKKNGIKKSSSRDNMLDMFQEDEVHFHRADSKKNSASSNIIMLHYELGQHEKTIEELEHQVANSIPKEQFKKVLQMFQKQLQERDVKINKLEREIKLTHHKLYQNQQRMRKSNNKDLKQLLKENKEHDDSARDVDDDADTDDSFQLDVPRSLSCIDKGDYSSGEPSSTIADDDEEDHDSNGNILIVSPKPPLKKNSITKSFMLSPSATKKVLRSTGKAVKKTAKAPKIVGKAVVKGTQAVFGTTTKAVVDTSKAVADVTTNAAANVAYGTGAVVMGTGKAVKNTGKAMVGYTVATGSAVAGFGSNITRALTRQSSTEFSGAKSKWDEGIEIIDEILLESQGFYEETEETKEDAACNYTLSMKQKEQLELIVKPLLIDGMKAHLSNKYRNQQEKLAGKDPIHHMPLKLIRSGLHFGTKAVGKGLRPVDVSLKYIMSEFGGIAEKSTPRYAMPRQGSMSSSGESYEAEIFVPPEFEKLSREKQVALFKLLSWSSLKQWDFNIFRIHQLSKGHPLFMVGWAILGSPHSQYAMAQACKIDVHFEDLDGYHFLEHGALKIPPRTLCNYLQAIEAAYATENPYHNEIHAADVVQTLHTFLQMCTSSNNASPNKYAPNERCPMKITTVEKFSILLSAVVHDVEHPGRNNAFEVNSQTDSALLYNDISVLENKHASRAFAIMFGKASSKNKRNSNLKDGDDCNILCNTSLAQRRLIRKLVIDAVLHTDMSKHFATVNSIKALMATTAAAIVSAAEEKQDVPFYLDDHSKWSVLMFLLHMADISSQAKPAPIFQLWTDRCMDEFFNQGDREVELGLPISFNCDRKTVKVPHSQTGFIEFVVRPGYEVVASILKPVEERVLPIIDRNLEYWESEKGENADADSVIESPRPATRVLKQKVTG